MNIKIKALCDVINPVLTPFIGLRVQSSLEARLAMSVHMSILKVSKTARAETEGRAGAGSGSSVYVNHGDVCQCELDFLVVLRSVLALKNLTLMQSVDRRPVVLFIESVEAAIHSVQSLLMGAHSLVSPTQVDIFSPRLALVSDEDFPVSDILPEIMLDTCMAEIVTAREPVVGKLDINFATVSKCRTRITQVIDAVLPANVSALLGSALKNKGMLHTLKETVSLLWRSEIVDDLQGTNAQVLLRYLGDLFSNIGSLFPTVCTQTSTEKIKTAVPGVSPAIEPFVKVAPLEKFILQMAHVLHCHADEQSDKPAQGYAALTSCLAAIPTKSGHLDTESPDFVRASVSLIFLLYTFTEVYIETSHFIHDVLLQISKALLFLGDAASLVLENERLSLVLASYMATVLTDKCVVTEPIKVRLEDVRLRTLRACLRLNARGQVFDTPADALDFSAYSLVLDSFTWVSLRVLARKLALSHDVFLNYINFFDVRYVSLLKLDGIVQKKIQEYGDKPLGQCYQFMAEMISWMHTLIDDVCFTDYFSEMLKRVNAMIDFSLASLESHRRALLNMGVVKALLHSVIELNPLIDAILAYNRSQTLETRLKVAGELQSVQSNIFLYARITPPGLVRHLSKYVTPTEVFTMTEGEADERITRAISLLNQKTAELYDTLSCVRARMQRLSGPYNPAERAHVVDGVCVYPPDRALRCVENFTRLSEVAHLNKAFVVLPLFVPLNAAALEMTSIESASTEAVSAAPRSDFFKASIVTQVSHGRPPLHPGRRSSC